MVATGNLEMSGDVRVFASFDALNPGSVDAKRYLVLTFTRSRTGMAADASIISDEKSVVHVVSDERNEEGYKRQLKILVISSYVNIGM